MFREFNGNSYSSLFSSMSPGGKESHGILKRISLGPEDEPRCAKLQSWQFIPRPLQMVLLEEKIMFTYNKSSKMHCLHVS